MNRTIPWFFFITIIATLSSCKKSERISVNKFADAILVKIAEFQDRRLPDSLSRYLNDSNALYRREAVLGFASIQDSSYVGRIGKLLLEDYDSGVRTQAAFALGQISSTKSEEVLYDAFLNEKNKFVLAEIIEGYGKVSKSWKLNLFSGDSILTRAQAWSYYRMGLRGFSDEALHAKAIALLNPASSRLTRLGAAHYFARGAKDYASHEAVLIQSALTDISPEVRMASTLALQKIKSETSFEAARKILRDDPDFRARINALRVLQVFAFPQTNRILVEALRDSMTSVGVTASEIIKASITKDFWIEISAIARATKNWRIQANLYEAALSVSEDRALAEEIQKAYDTTLNPYKKAALLNALQHAVISFEFVHENLFKNNEPVVKLAAASALVAMNHKKSLNESFQARFAKTYEHAIKSGDMAVIGTIADALADSALNYKSTIKDISFLHDARSKLALPKDVEAIIPLEQAIAYFEGKQIYSPAENSFNHPIPWNLVQKISSNQKAIIKTSKGNINIRLFVEDAPGSVANFVTLAMNKYYDSKFFHRVVPNFVVQTGCNRGDGWGSEDYSIRSEFSHHRYKTGSVGMASAGKDTEGTQWFITHSPTPHLDGRYTIFAEVESGLDVLHNLEVGDRIITVEIINFAPL